MIKNILLISIILLLGACVKNNASTIPTTIGETSFQTISKKNLVSAANSVNALGADLYSQLQNQPGNLFLSPYSISSAFIMAYAGANENTKTQMTKVLHFDKKIYKSFATLNQLLVNKSSDSTYQLNVANALWGQKGLRYLIEYIDLSQEFGTKLKSVDFNNNLEESRQQINKWTAIQTRDNIKELLSPDILNKQTKLVLTNAIYFKGNWQFPFDEKDTKDLPFKISEKETINIPTMTKTSKFKYMENDTMQVVELPYKGMSLSMLVILPKNDLTAIIGQFDSLEKELVKVYLPRFKIESTLQLKKSFEKLGMKDAFDPKQADFSGINGEKNLVISAVVHKAFVEVNEKGTEAGAATGVVITTRELLPKPIEFRADKPFIFLIRDNASKAILFFGKVTNPK